MSLFNSTCMECSQLITQRYSTSFSMGIKVFDKAYRAPIYAIYGFVRFADEIVDTFHDFNKRELLDEFKLETYRAIERGISLNPVLNSFQKVVNDFKIDVKLIDTFLKSMEMDLEKKDYDFDGYKEYILGSAEVVGLMCLRVFVKGNQKMYDELTPYAMSLGSAFQKINFLRDLNADFIGMGRIYFPNVDMQKLNDETKASIEKDIEIDFEMGLQGIKMLPKKARLGVYVAYIYYNSLFKKIKKLKASNIIEERIRIPNPQKIALFAGSYLRNSFNML